MPIEFCHVFGGFRGLTGSTNLEFSQFFYSLKFWQKKTNKKNSCRGVRRVLQRGSDCNNSYKQMLLAEKCISRALCNVVDPLSSNYIYIKIDPSLNWLWLFKAKPLFLKPSVEMSTMKLFGEAKSGTRIFSDIAWNWTSETASRHLSCYFWLLLPHSELSLSIKFEPFRYESDSFGCSSASII